MGITNAHLSYRTFSNPKNAVDPILIVKNGKYDGRYEWVICFHTLYGWNVQDSIDISVNPALIPKFNADNTNSYHHQLIKYDPNSYFKTDKWWWRNFTKTEWSSAGGTVSGSDSSGYDWTIPITSIIDEHKDYIIDGTNPLTFFSDSAPSGSWGNLYKFDYRTGDAYFFEVHIATNYQENGKTVHSDIATIRTHLDFAPIYTVESSATYSKWVHITRDGLWIPYIATDWMRSDDRWVVDKDIRSGEKIICRANKLIWGSVYKYGRIGIPWSQLNAIPEDGDTISVGRIRFNAIYRNSGAEFATMDLTGARIVNDMVCNTPTITGYALEDGTVCLTVGDSGTNQTGESHPITEYHIKLDTKDYVDGIDDKTVVPDAAGGSVSFVMYEPPWDSSLVYKVIGFDADDNASKPAYVIIDPIPSEKMNGIYRFTWVIGNDIGQFARLSMQYNMQESQSMAPIYQTKKLAGRTYDSVFYGQGRSGSYRIDGVAVLDASQFYNASNDILTIGSVEDDIYTVLIGHPVLMRTAGGERAYVAVTSCDVTVPRTMSEMVSVSLSCTRVS